jgi:hypothetical protein
VQATLVERSLCAALAEPAQLGLISAGGNFNLAP